MTDLQTLPISIRFAAVVGAGTMGAGIAMALANADIPVLLKETDPAALDRGRDFGPIWQPAPLLKELADQERNFYE